jgi:hypothetical protein
MYYKLPNGDETNHPPTKEHAREINDPWYSDYGERCDYCGRNHPTRYVSDDSCLKCLIDSHADIHASIDHDKYVLTNKPCRGGSHFITTLRGYKKCAICQNIKEKSPPSPREIAREAGETWYMPEYKCQKCGQQALRRVVNGQCRGCNPLQSDLPPKPLSPRQAAIAAGDTWYLPDKPCLKCGKIEFKRVHDGQCEGCKP